MEKKLKILILIKEFWRSMAKHKTKFDMIKELETFAEIKYWYMDGHLPEILNELNFQPDFIFHYDIAWGYGLSPNITGMEEVSIPKAAFVIDTHFNKEIRKKYFETNKIDLIFSVTKTHFLSVYLEYKDKFRWLPWSINPNIFKDWEQEKTIDFLLMGLMAPKGVYPFRERIIKEMEHEESFVYHQHPGHKVRYKTKAYVNEKYAQEINKAKIFFTCGSIYGYPVLKFFEVPGSRTLMLAEPNQDILDLGFKDGINFVACTQSNFQQKAKYYLEHEEERKMITDNGYTFIHNNHSNKARALQFIDYISEYLMKNSDS